MDSQAGNDENIRTEYTALCANLNQLASFRFTLVGFYIAALGLIVAGNPGKDSYSLMLWISFCFWILELRNRQLHSNMAERGRQIETYWGSTGESFISHWSGKKLSEEARMPFLFFKVRLPVSHSLGLDLLFLGVIVYSVLQIVQ